MRYDPDVNRWESAPAMQVFIVALRKVDNTVMQIVLVSFVAKCKKSGCSIAWKRSAVKALEGSSLHMCSVESSQIPAFSPVSAKVGSGRTWSFRCSQDEACLVILPQLVNQKPIHCAGRGSSN